MFVLVLLCIYLPLNHCLFFIFSWVLFSFLIILIKLKNTLWGSTPQSSCPGEGYFQVLIKNNLNLALKLINWLTALKICFQNIFLLFPQKYFTWKFMIKFLVIYIFHKFLHVYVMFMNSLILILIFRIKQNQLNKSSQPNCMSQISIY